MENQFGQESKLALTAVLDGEKTVLRDVSFTAPFKIMRPFYEKPDVMTVMLLTASAGIMAGDRQNFHIQVKQGAKMEFVSQAYEKIHKMEEGDARRHTLIQIEEGASLFYTPLPTIPFKDSAYRNMTEISLADETSKFIMTEVLSCGRVARGERFAYRYFQNTVSIRQAGKLIYRDNTRYEPQKMEMETFGMYEGFTHLANIIICNDAKDEDWVRDVREMIDSTPDMEGGVTQNGQNLTIIRILGTTAQKLTDITEKILTYS
jgi:urease accessory protein